MYTLLLFLSWFVAALGDAPANITNTQFLRDPEVLLSNNTQFKIGFFSPINSTNRYVGIWYSKKHADTLEVVWIANRDNPLKDSSGVLKVSEDGNLQVVDGRNNVFWSSNVSYVDGGNNSVLAQLQDSGNLVLLFNGTIIWQSFDHPTDSLLPRMRASDSKIKREKRQLRSWKTPWDPSSGRFTSGISARNFQEVFVWDGDRPHWRSGPWNGNIFIGVPSMYYTVLTDGFSLVNDDEGTLSIMFASSDPSFFERYVLTYDGVVTQKRWNLTSGKWEITWQSVESGCDVYGICGAFGICSPRKSPICSCLMGFEPKNEEEWSKGNWTSGCIRRKPLQCGASGGKQDGFRRLRNVKVPDNAHWSYAVDEDACRRHCLDNCSCLGYAYYLGIGCMIWNGSLIDMQEFSVTSVDVLVRLAHSELDKAKRWRIILIIVTIVGTTALCLCFYCLWRWMGRRKAENRVSNKNTPCNNLVLERHVSEVKFKDLALFKFDKLEVATNHFRESNKLGRGGFGHVYKGELEDGQVIAVKRLSRASGQGLEEFMNEVVVISKLQHRNLVRLLGCCVEGEEKMLVYEYMPNKSLDALLFDTQHREILNWKKRYIIIQGICRGLLYLHRDSRLRIIHRDLKASNILLDEDLNPKISDFGMARIFGGKEDQANTSRVVGTYGYMSPEYAMEGCFSEKSDVYSFGVLLLEIISGRRNSSFTDDESFSLLLYAWRLWNEDDISSLIDPAISDPCSQAEILKCIHMGLLCVQEFPEDRPNISSIVYMLDSETTDLPQPTQPGFARRRITHSDKIDLYSSANYATITSLSGR